MSCTQNCYPLSWVHINKYRKLLETIGSILTLLFQQQKSIYNNEQARYPGYAHRHGNFQQENWEVSKHCTFKNLLTIL